MSEAMPLLRPTMESSQGCELRSNSGAGAGRRAHAGEAEAAGGGLSGSGCVAWEEPRPPACWSHPLVLLPSASAALLVLSGALWQLTGRGPLVSAVLMLSCISALGLASLLAILWCLGEACCRKEGPRPGGQNPPFLVDFLEVGAGSIGMSIAPGRKRKAQQRDLFKDVRALRYDFRCDVVVTLLEHRELQVMEVERMGEAVEAEGMAWLHFPIRDKWIPGDTRAFLVEVVAPVARWLREGRRVLVHCNGGKGRTGTLVAAVLLTSSGFGLDVRTLDDATRLMRSSRPGMLKNPLQRAYLLHLRQALAMMRPWCSTAFPPL